MRLEGAEVKLESKTFTFLDLLGFNLDPRDILKTVPRVQRAMKELNFCTS